MLQRQIMFKQLQELQKQKNLQDLHNARQQDIINQQSFFKQASPLIYGPTVHDKSQIFMPGNTNFAHGLSNKLVHSQSQNQDRNFLARSVTQGLDIEGQTGICHRNASFQELDGGQEQSDMASLDPLEHKILFNTNDNDWGASFSEHMFEKTDCFPSVQSGSWSALMQAAVAETCSDTGVQDEWSGLSFQNPEPSPSNLAENENHPIPLIDNDQSKSKLLNKANASSSFHGFQHYPATNSQFPKSPLQYGQVPLTDIQRNFETSVDKTSRSSVSSGMSAFLDRSGVFPALNSTSQTSHNMLELLHKVDETNAAPTMEVSKAEPAVAFTPSYDSSCASQYFGLRLAPPTQKPLINYFDSSQISQQTVSSMTSNIDNLETKSQQYSKYTQGESIKAFQRPQSDNNQIHNQNFATNNSQYVSFPTRPPNVWVDVPTHQNPSSMGSFRSPHGSHSTTNEANNKIEAASEAPNFLETDTHVIKSQSFDYPRGLLGKGYYGKESFSGHREANASSSSLLPMNSDPSIRGVIKNERVHTDAKIPQIPSTSQLNSAYGNYGTVPFSSGLRDQLVKNSSQPPRQDISCDTIMYKKDGFHGQPASIDVASNSTEISHLSSPRLPHLDVANQNLVALKSKKRKFNTYALLPWHKEATEGCSRLQDMSTAEVEWAKAANLLPEKLKEEPEALGNSLRMVHPKKRLILTTKLMQRLFRPAPTSILSDNTTSNCDTLTYFAARLALGDACSLAYDKSELSSEKTMTSKSSSDQDLSKVVEYIIDRSKRLEYELLRLEDSGSIVDIRVETQSLEKFSVINRFAKFHSRAQLVAGETAGASVGPKLYPQRYVTARPMPTTVPEGQHCLSL